VADPSSERLQEAFGFEAADLPANRAGRLSPRQEALLRAGRSGMRLALAVFVAVMCGTVGLVAFTMWPARSGGEPASREAWIGLGAVVAAVAGAIGLGAWQSRGFMAAARSRRILVAAGPAAVVSARGRYRVRIGPTELRVASATQLDALEPGAAYRVHYLAGPVALVLSAEPAGAAAMPAAAAAVGAVPSSLAAAQLETARRGSVIVVLVGVLALGLPVAIFATAGLGEGPRWLVALGLLAVAIGFGGFALWWLLPGDRW
jgi:hypothetical protein